MQRHVPQGEPEFEQFVHALPADWEDMMRDLGAFTYAGKIQSPEGLLRALFLYGGPDQSLREVAGTLTLHTERITDQAVWKRLQRCAPFLKALVKKMLPLDALPPMPQHLRFLACDGTTVQHPGATSSDYRLHLVLHLVTLRLHDVQVTETKIGESLKQYRLHAGDVMVGDQGYCSYAGILHTVEQQHADVLVRWNHQRALYDPQAPNRALDFCPIFKTQAPGTIESRAVVLKYAATSQTKDQRTLHGTLHVYRMQEKEAQAARKKVSRKHQKKQRKLSTKTLFLRQFVCVFTS
jgi:Transposase DDE domain